MSIETEVRRALEIDGKEYNFSKDLAFGFWSIEGPDGTIPSKYTSWPKAVEAAKQKADELMKAEGREPEQKEIPVVDVKEPEPEERVKEVKPKEPSLEEVMKAKGIEPKKRVMRQKQKLPEENVEA